MRHKRFTVLGILALLVGFMLVSVSDAQAGRRHHRRCYDPCWNSCWNTCYSGYGWNNSCCGDNWGCGGYTTSCCQPSGTTMQGGQMQGQPMQNQSPREAPAAPQTNPVPPAPAETTAPPK